MQVITNTMYGTTIILVLDAITTHIQSPDTSRMRITLIVMIMMIISHEIVFIILTQSTCIYILLIAMAFPTANISPHEVMTIRFLIQWVITLIISTNVLRTVQNIITTL